MIFNKVFIVWIPVTGNVSKMDERWMKRDGMMDERWMERWMTAGEKLNVKNMIVYCTEAMLSTAPRAGRRGSVNGVISNL